MALDGNWQLLRTFAAQAGETIAKPIAATFSNLAKTPINGEAPRFIEFGLDQGVLAGTANPDSVTFHFFRLGPVVAPNVLGLVDRVRTYTVPFADIGLMAPVILEYYGVSVAVLVSFTGGTSPNLSGSLYMRGLN